MCSTTTQLSFADLLLNPSVRPEDEQRLSRQAGRILRLFVRARQQGRLIATTDLIAVAGQYQARLYEVRRYLVPRGFCIDLTRRGKDGLNYYKMLPLCESTFYKQHPELHYL
jgi:hypothetical protein